MRLNDSEFERLASAVAKKLDLGKSIKSNNMKLSSSASVRLDSLASAIAHKTHQKITNDKKLASSTMHKLASAVSHKLVNAGSKSVTFDKMASEIASLLHASRSKEIPIQTATASSKNKKS